MTIVDGTSVITRRSPLRALGSVALVVVVLLIVALWWSAGSASGAEADSPRAAAQAAPVGQVWPILWLGSGLLVTAGAWWAATRAGRRDATQS